MGDVGDHFTLIEATAAIVSVGALIAIVISTLSYVRAINAVCDIIREKKPPGWERGLFNSGLDGKDAPNPKQVFWYGWIFWLILGVWTLDLPDNRYRQLLWTARARLVACVGIWLVWIAIFGWLFRSPA